MTHLGVRRGAFPTSRQRLEANTSGKLERGALGARSVTTSP
jgi:hypothetical protein